MLAIERVLVIWLLPPFPRRPLVRRHLAGDLCERSPPASNHSCMATAHDLRYSCRVDALPLEELEYVYRSLSLEERDELLQSLLIAASHSGETVIQRLEDLLLIHAVRELTARAC